MTKTSCAKMNEEICIVCSAVNVYLVDILNTNLQLTFENLTDLKVNNESHYLCFICNQRLHQCYQLQELAINKNLMGLYNNNNEKKHLKTCYPLIQLSRPKLLNMSIPNQTEIIIKTKQEMVEENGCVLSTDMKKNNLGYLQEQEIKKEENPSKYLSFQSNNSNCFETGTDSPVLQRIAQNDQINNLIMYYKTHTNDKPFKCDVCNKPFSHIRSLIRHKRTHTGEKPYSCDVCNKTFSLSSYLKSHERTHTGDKPYSCGVCNKSFSLSSYLKSHEKIHIGDRSYKCDICNKIFSQKSSFIKHKRTHSDDKPYRCDVCNKTFTRSSNLNKHKRTQICNKSYTCNICYKTFSDGYALINHKKTHTGDKPYTCGVCNKTFSTGRYLKSHERTHICDKSYNCEYCKNFQFLK